MLTQCLNKFGVSFKEIHCPVTWTSLLKNCPNAPYKFSWLKLKYQFEYHSSLAIGSDQKFYQLQYQQKFVGLFPIAILEFKNRIELSTFGEHIHSPVWNSQLSIIDQKVVAKIVLRSLVHLAKTSHCASLVFQTELNSFGEYTAFHKALLEYPTVTNLKNFMKLKLTKNFNSVKSKFRKSYLPIIDKSNEIYKTNLLIGCGNSAIWNDIRKFHSVVAGRKTRSLKTWKIQLDMIEANEAFVVTANNKRNELVGAGLFSFFQNEAAYDIGVYDRTPSKNPISHLIQYKAIEKMCESGIQVYFIGEKTHRNKEKLTTKIDKISFFKEGFCSDIFPIFINTLYLDKNDGKTC